MTMTPTQQAHRRELLGTAYSLGVARYAELHGAGQIKPSAAFASMDLNSEWSAMRCEWADPLVHWTETVEIATLIMDQFNADRAIINELTFFFFRGFLCAAQAYAGMTIGGTEGFPACVLDPKN